MDQNELKRQVAWAALEYVPEGEVIGVGSGSTVNLFIDALGQEKSTAIRGAVASSEASATRLKSYGIKVFDLNEVRELSVYVDGADEIDPCLRMIKGGGAALTREKIVAAASKQFVCICDQSKKVEVLGTFPLPIEVIPMARETVIAQMNALGGQATLREGCITDNGNIIIDVRGIKISQPEKLELYINNIAGVVTNGIFAMRPADILLIGAEQGVQKTLRPPKT